MDPDLLLITRDGIGRGCGVLILVPITVVRFSDKITDVLVIPEERLFLY